MLLCAVLLAAAALSAHGSPVIVGRSLEKSLSHPALHSLAPAERPELVSRDGYAMPTNIRDAATRLSKRQARTGPVTTLDLIDNVIAVRPHATRAR